MPTSKNETPRSPGHPPGSSASPAEVNLEDAAESKSGSSPMTPSERDEATGSTGGIPSDRVQQGSRDVKRGIRDTSRGEESDRAYDKLKK